MVICRDAQYMDKPLETVPENELTCSEPTFDLSQDRYGPYVLWNGSNSSDEPPFSTYSLYYSKLMNIGKF